MDFFELQDQARRRSTLLVVLFAIAVVLIITVLYLVATVIFQQGSQYAASRSPGGSPVTQPGFWNPQLLLAVGGGTLVIIALGSLYKVAQLRGGGRVVAESLGGRLLSPDTTDPVERKILNVVEEMAIASGTPVPPVYMMDNETNINAFAAGYAPDDAVIGVTRGCVENLSRDELQGVMAHEFSHILNGDMRMNIRLIGLINGILVIGLVGYYIIRSLRFAAYSSRSRRNSKGGNAVLAIFLFGLVMMILGFIGTLFGNIIKAAVSRQREYLADASAVQFTRNPDGIGGALKKIGGFTHRAQLQSPAAEEASHMFFANGVAMSISSLFSTHPPLERRIRQIDRHWDGKFVTPTPRDTAADRESEQKPAQAQEQQRQRATAMMQIGVLTAAHLSYARQLLDDLPRPVVDAAHDPYSARAIVYTLLLADDPQVRRTQFEHLAAHGDEGIAAATEKLADHLPSVSRAARLPLIDMTLSSLREMTAAQYQAFKQNLQALAQADEKIELFEWMLLRLVEKHLEPHFTKATPPRYEHYHVKNVAAECSTLLSVLAHAGHKDTDEAQRAYDAAMAKLELTGMPMASREQVRLSAVGTALDALKAAVPKVKRTILDAAATCIALDQKVTATEAELLRAAADSLDVPMPPLLPGQPLS